MALSSQQRVVQYCSSLGQPCGISTYTEFLAEAQNMQTASTIQQLKELPCTHVHVQHEFGMMNLQQLKAVRKFCLKERKIWCITMHTVIPQPGLLRFLLYRFCGLRQKRSSALWVWDERNPDYGLRAYWQYRQSQHYICKNAEKIIVHNEAAKRALQNMGAKHVEVVPHGIQWYPTYNTLLSLRDGKLHVGCFGHANPNRGLLDIIEACKHIDNVHLHIHASAQMTDEHDVYLEKVHQAVQGKEWITFDTSHAQLKDVVAQLSQYDVNVWYCDPPGGISTSGSICQYIAARRPIIASDTVMVEDVRDAVTTVPPSRPDLLAEALRQYNTDTNRLRELCSQRTWKHARPSYTNQLFPSFRSHFLYWGSHTAQQQEIEEAVCTVDDMCIQSSNPTLNCTNLTELHSRFMVDPLLVYNHQYNNGNPDAASPKKTLLFLHLQKTGGTTLAHIIRRNVRSIGLRLDFSGQPNINPAFLLDAFHKLSPRRKRQERQKWSAYDVMTNHFSYGMHDLVQEPYAYITMLRDPVARCVSYYRSLQEQPETSWIGSKTYAGRARDLSLLEFLEDPFFQKAITLGLSSTQMLAGTRDIEITDYHLHRAKKNMATFEAVLLTEEFEKSLEILGALYGWKAETFNGKHVEPWDGNRVGRITGGDKARSELSHMEIARIEDLFRFDMELYAYAQKLFTEQYAKLQRGESLTFETGSRTLVDMSNKVDNSKQCPSFLCRIKNYGHCIIRIPTNLARIAAYGGQMKDQLSKLDHLDQLSKLDHLDQLSKLDHLDHLDQLSKLDHLDQLSHLIHIAESTKALEPHVDSVADRVIDMHTRLDTIIDRLTDLQKVPDHMKDIGPQWGVLMDRMQDMTTQANGIAYNMNEVIASLEVIADLAAITAAKHTRVA